MADSVELIRHYIDAWNRGDEEAFLDGVTDDVVIRSALLAESTGDGVYRGREGARTWFREIVGTLAMRFDIVETLSRGDLLLVIFNASTRGARSGVGLEREIVTIFRRRSERFSAALGYADACEAIEEFARLVREAEHGALTRDGRGRSPSDAVAIVRAFFDAWNRRDEDALRAVLHPQLEARSALTAMEGGDGRVRGIEEGIAVFRNNVETLGFTFELRQALVHRGFVLVLADNTARVAERGLELGQEYGMVFEVRDGLITRCLTYFDPADAFEEMARLVRR